MMSDEHDVFLREFSFLPGVFMLAGLLCLPAVGAEFWVAPDGADGNPGTRAEPLASPADALRKARELRRLSKEPLEDPVRIVLRHGVYRPTAPVLVRPEDSGTATSPTIIEAAAGEQPVLSGGVVVHGWRKSDQNIEGLPAVAQGRVWVSEAPRFEGRLLEFRQMYVGGRKAIRAREPDDDQLPRLLAWDRTGQEAWISSEYANWRPVPGVEMFIHQQWEIAILRVKSVRVEGDRACVTYYEPESRIQFEHPWPQPVVDGPAATISPFLLTNAIEFLDTPGEWYQEKPSGRIIYWPRPDEDMTRAEVVVPALETLVEVAGSVDRPVSYVRFKGIGFEYTTWMRPSEDGHVPLQAGMYLLDAYRLTPPGTKAAPKLSNQAWVGRQPAAVSVAGAHNILFERCRFEHLAATGLDFQSSTHDDVVEGCVFRDIGGNGIMVGSFQEGGVETHVAYNPADERVVCQRERIANNLVTECGTEDWGCVGIAVGYGREISIEHNEVSHLPYSGISLGWGWTKLPNCLRDNRVHANHVHHVGMQMCDLACVYTLSAQPGTVISENWLHDIELRPYVHRPEHWYYVYLDEGSSFITVRDNWYPEDRTFENDPGPDNRWLRNGPSASPEITENAGLEPAYRDLLPETEQNN